MEIYALAVCFVTIICAAVALGIGAYDILEISSPEMTLRAYKYEKYQTNEAFTRQWKKDRAKKSEEEITVLRKKSYEVALKAEKRDAVQSSIRVLIILFIDMAIFYIHWRIAKRARE